MDQTQEIMMLDVAVLNTCSRLKSCIESINRENNTINTFDLGLLVRLRKLLDSFMRSAREQDDMTATIIERCIYETCITIRYLAEKGSPEMYKAFLESDAMRKQNLVEYLESFNHPSAKLMQDMVKQLKKEVADFGFDKTKFNRKYPSSWHPKVSYAAMAKDLDDKALQSYQLSYARSSEVLHQSWSDLTMHHVIVNDQNELEPKMDNEMVIISSIANVTCNILSALESFCDNKAVNKTLSQMVKLDHKGLHSPPTNSFVAVGSLPYNIVGDHPLYQD